MAFSSSKMFVIAVFAGLVLWLALPPAADPFSSAWLQEQGQALGPAGPLLVTLVLALAIVVSPIPSGPIAIVGGALYGPIWGTVVVVCGAQIGAMVAFGLSRHLGYSAARGSAHPVLAYLTAPRSAAVMMAVVFLSRLVPFISFDAVSYAAGLTSLSFWRFALATLAGVAPVSLALAALGAGLVKADEVPLLVTLLASGVTLIPTVLIWLWVRSRRRW